MMNPLLTFAPAIVAVALLFAFHLWRSRRFNRRHPHLTRRALLERQPDNPEVVQPQSISKTDTVASP